MSRKTFLLPGTALQWAAWLLALALHGLALWLLGPLQPARPAAPTALVMALLPPPAPAAPAPAQPAQPKSPPPPLSKAPPPQAAARPKPSAPPPLASSAAAPVAAAVQAAPAQAEPAHPQEPSPAPTPVAVLAEKPPAPVVRPAIYRAAYLNNPEPDYPAMSRRAGESGRVVLEVRISAEGRAESVQLFSSSGYPRLDMAAQDAVRNWRFEPAREGERAIASLARIPVDFTLE